VFAPLLRFVPGQKVTRPPDAPRPVTTRRRLLGMLLDLLSVALLSYFLFVVRNVVALYLADDATRDWLSSAPVEVVLWWLPAILLLLLVPMLGNGGTLGQRVIMLNPVGRDGNRP